MLKKLRNLVLALGLVLHILSPLAVQASESDWVWVETSPAQPAIPEQPAIEEVWELTEGRHVVMGNPGPDVFPFPEPQTIPGVVELILNNGWDPSTINEANLIAIFGYYIINQPYDVWEQLHWFPTADAWAEWCMIVNDEQSGVGPCTSMTSGQVGQFWKLVQPYVPAQPAQPARPAEGHWYNTVTSETYYGENPPLDNGTPGPGDDCDENRPGPGHPDFIMAVPTNVRIENHILSWNATCDHGTQDNMRYYIVVNGVITTHTGPELLTSFDLRTLNLPVGTHSIQVRSINQYADLWSDYSEAVEYVVLADDYEDDHNGNNDDDTTVTPPPTDPDTGDNNGNDNDNENNDNSGSDENAGGNNNNETTRPTLPQTGAATVSTLLAGLALTGSGILAAKLKNKK